MKQWLIRIPRPEEFKKEVEEESDSEEESNMGKMPPSDSESE